MYSLSAPTLKSSCNTCVAAKMTPFIANICQAAISFIQIYFVVCQFVGLLLRKKGGHTRLTIRRQLQQEDMRNNFT